ncbi:MAG: MerR family transcriptional regulator [Deltaproteobacteria bacterium]|nr:MerR family transcriptional regulator [Deltaproteobacteria bacterium]
MPAEDGAPRRPTLPEKKYFKIGEVADLVGVEPHVLRYWETQFPQVRPHKARSGHRLYRRREVETLLAIRELLHVQRFTIAGARQALRQSGGAASLLPRFFDVPNEASADTTPPQYADLDGDGIDVTDPDGAPAGQHHALAGDGDGEGSVDGGAMAAVEVLGLEPEALRAALSREQAERGARRGVAEIDVLAEEGREATPAPPAMAARGALSLAPARRALVEGALADARKILALLDREDQRERRALI